MTIAHRFDYVRPDSLAAALQVLAERGPGARLLAGGTDLVAWLRDDADHPDVVVDVKHLPGLSGISIEDGRVRIGALVTFTEIIESDLIAQHLPMLAEASHTVASNGIRNRATLVGNLCSAVPSCDAGPPLLSYEGTVHAAGPDGERSVPAEEWFTGPRATVIEPGEIVTHVTLPIPGDHGACYLKLSRYRGEDLAQVGVAVVATPGGEYRVSFGAVGPVPFRAPEIEAHLAGRDLDDEVIAGAEALVDGVISPISDVRASAAYRSHMSRVMLRRALRAAVGRLRGDGPAYGAELL